MSNFAFIDNDILRKNLDIAFDHIIELLAVSDSDFYKNKPLLISSFRKTIIILMASIIEALLLWKLKRTTKSKIIELSDEYKYFDIRTLHVINKKVKEEIIAGKRKKERKKLDRLDFIRIIDLCFKYNIFKKVLHNELNKVRKLRNKLHIGGLEKIEKKYTQKDLKFVFSVAKKVDSVVQV